MDGLKDVIVSKLLPIVGKAAPLLGGVLGTPLAGVAISLLASTFGVGSQNVDDIVKSISSNPEAAIKLKSLEYEHAETLEKIISANYGIEVDDRKDARKNAILYKDFLRHMAYLVTAGFFGALVMLFIPLEYNVNERELLSMLVGMLVSKWQTIIDFFYGSSRKQGNKGETK